MPRTRLDHRPKHEHLARLLYGVIHLEGGTIKAASEKIRMSDDTLSRRLKNPGSITLDELVNIGRRLGISIDDLRAAIRY